MKIGAFTFGGGYAMIPLIQREVCENKKWMKEQDILDIVAIAESTPGPIAINAATFVGSRTGGSVGACLATLGVVLPSFVIILIIAKCYQRFKTSKAVDSVMSGLKPAVVGMIGAAFLSVGRTVFFPSGLQADRFTQASFWVFLGIFAVSAVLAFKKVNPIKIIVLSAAVGIGAGYSPDL